MPIATQHTGGREPIQVQSEALRHWQAPAPFDRGFGFALAEDVSVKDEDLPTTGWREADLKRAIDAAEKSGLKSYRVEIAPDGTISIIVGDQV